MSRVKHSMEQIIAKLRRADLMLSEGKTVDEVAKAGSYFSSPATDEIIVGTLMAKQLRIIPGETVTILANTVDGTMNALDLKVAGTFTSGIDEVDGQVIYCHLEIAQKILDTKKVDLAILKFNDSDLSEKSNEVINKKIKSINPNYKARTWRNLAVLYSQVEKFYHVQIVLVGIILFTLMFFGILNTVSMAVVERIGEIGTLRALGEKRKDIVKQFLLENIITAFVGIILGGLFAKLLIMLFNAANISTEMPGASTPFIIQINFLFSALFISSGITYLVAVIATIVPAFKAARADIIEALRKNI